MAADFVFLILIVGVPVTVIAILVRTVVKGVFISAVFKNLADSNGWDYFRSGKGHSLNNILDAAVFTGGIDGRRIGNILDAGNGMYFCDCRYTERDTKGRRSKKDCAVAVAGRENSSPVFRVLRSRENAAAKPSGAPVEEQFERIEGESWDRLLVSSLDAFNQAGWSGIQAEALKTVMDPGSTLFLTESRLILVLPGFLYTRKIIDLKANIEKLQQLL